MHEYKATVCGEFPIFLGMDARELLLEQIDLVGPDKILVVTDRTVEMLFIEELQEHLPSSTDMEIVVMNDGEANKNLANLEHIAGDLIRVGANDNSLVLNFGGGVVLNMGGLAASMLGHGIRFAQVPTTSAAMWSSANTNRQAVNMIGIANVFGVYRSPEFVVADPFFLEEQEATEIRSGLAGFVRNALLLGGDAFDQAEATLTKDPVSPKNIESTLRLALEQALELGRRDPEECKEDAGSDYGAPLGHAIERLSDGKLTANEAQVHGMRLAGEVAASVRVIDQDSYRRHQDVLATLAPSPVPEHIRTDRLVYKLHGNNKTLVGKQALVLLESLGKLAGGGSVEVSDQDIALAFERIRSA